MTTNNFNYSHFFSSNAAFVSFKLYVYFQTKGLPVDSHIYCEIVNYFVEFLERFHGNKLVNMLLHVKGPSSR